MIKVCVSRNKKCKDCEHYKYDVNYNERCCYAEPDENGEVRWKPKYRHITYSSSCG